MIPPGFRSFLNLKYMEGIVETFLREKTGNIYI